MNRLEELRTVCIDVLAKGGIEDGWMTEAAEEIAIKLLQLGYIRWDKIELDQEKAVQLLADILNRFNEEKPFTVIE